MIRPPCTIWAPPALAIRTSWVTSYPGAPMMKSPSLSLSAVLVVVCNRPETDVPKRLGEVDGELGVLSTNWMPESGFDSAVASENVPVKPASAWNQIRGAGRLT